MITLQSVDIALHSSLNYHSFFHIHMWDWCHRPSGLLNVCLGTEPVCLHQYCHLTHRSQSEMSVCKDDTDRTFFINGLFSERKDGIPFFLITAGFVNSNKNVFIANNFCFQSFQLIPGLFLISFSTSPDPCLSFHTYFVQLHSFALALPSHLKLSVKEAGKFCMIYVLFWKLGLAI